MWYLIVSIPDPCTLTYSVCPSLQRHYFILQNYKKNCVRINGMSMDFCDVKCVLKQDCLPSPLLFTLYIDDHIRDMKLLNLGIEVENDKNCILSYANDVILVANTEEELYSLLNCLNSWSERNCLKINKDRSKIIHFRRLSTFHVVT